jgi:hypothetical protein
MPKSEVNAPVTSAPTDRLALTESPGRGAEMSGLSRPICAGCYTYSFADDE